jgi:hypothetical protein
MRSYLIESNNTCKYCDGRMVGHEDDETFHWSVEQTIYQF